MKNSRILTNFIIDMNVTPIGPKSCNVVRLEPRAPPTPHFVATISRITTCFILRVDDQALQVRPSHSASAKIMAKIMSFDSL